jgi:putative phage tail fiber protein
MDGGLKEKKMNIVIEIKGQQAKIVNRHEIISGIAKLEGIEFIFSDEWDSFTKTAVIYVDEYDKTTAIKLLVENNKIEASQLPSSLFKEDCELFVGIFGDSENGQRITSTVVCQPIKEGTPVDAADEACPDIYNQIINIMSETKALVKEATDKVEINGEYLEKASEKATDAENSAKKTKEYLNAAEQNKSEVEKLTEQSKKYSESASSSAESASKSASSASVSASSASQSALNAEGSATNAGTSATKAAVSEKNAKASEESAKKSESNVNQAVTEFEQKRADSIAEINKTTTNSKKEISDLTDAKKTELNKINDDITQNASELKEAIVNAADAKKEEINQKGLEVLASIPEEFSKVEDTTLIKPTESGTEMMLTDSSDMNIQELHLYGKTEQKTTKGIQLLNLKDAKGGTGDGVTYTPNGDGSFKKTGTATGQAGNIWLKGDYYSDLENRTPIITLEVGKSYYIKHCAIFQGKTIILSSESGQVINVTEEKYPEGIKITGIRNTGFTLNKTYNEVIYPIVAESSTAVDWEEYTGGQPSPNPDYPQEIKSIENPTVSVAGKNLFEPSTINYSYNNLRITANVDNSQKNSIKIKINTINATEGDLYALAYVDINKFVKKIKSNTTYTIVLKNPQNIGAVFVGTIIGTNRITNTVAVKSNVIKLQTIDDISNKSTFPLVFYFAGTVKENVTIGFDDIAVYEGEYSNAEIEEYKPIQSAQQTCELNGIGDVKDELIVRADGTGQLVQKIKSYDCSQISRDLQQSPNKEYYYLPAIDKNTTNASRVLSTHFTSKTFDKKWGNVFKVNGNFYFGEKEAPDNISDKNAMKQWLIENKVKILFQLEEPIVTELSSEEVQKILTLHTNKPNTTIWNDQNAEMQITYVADTKTYIDNKMAELQALLLEKGE